MMQTFLGTAPTGPSNVMRWTKRVRPYWLLFLSLCPAPQTLGASCPSDRALLLPLRSLPDGLNTGSHATTFKQTCKHNELCQGGRASLKLAPVIRLSVHFQPD